MSSPTGKTMREDKKATIRLILTICGAFLIVLGLSIIVMPDIITTFIITDDHSLAYIFGGALMMVGVSDIAIARILFKQTIDHFDQKESEL